MPFWHSTNDKCLTVIFKHLCLSEANKKQSNIPDDIMNLPR